MEWADIQTLGTWSQSTRLQELERSFLRQIKWYLQQDLEAWYRSDYLLRWLQSLTHQSHPWLALSLIYCIWLPFCINQPNAQHSFPKFISFSMRHTLHPRCVFIICPQLIFWCVQRLSSSWWALFFRNVWGNISAMYKSQAWDHPHSHVSQTVAAPCSRSHMGYYRWLMMSKICSRLLYTWLAYIPIVSNKYSVCTPVKHRKMAVYSCNRTITSQDFVSMAFLQYGAYLYSTIFCMAVAVYGMVVSPKLYMVNRHTGACVGWSPFGNHTSTNGMEIPSVTWWLWFWTLLRHQVRSNKIKQLTRAAIT